MKKKRVAVLNAAFLLASVAILIFLLKAPQETTARLPKDQDHMRFFSMEDKKEAEKFCGDCHSPDQIYPLPESHPPKYRCLFCHKKEG